MANPIPEPNFVFWLTMLIVMGTGLFLTINLFG